MSFLPPPWFVGAQALDAAGDPHLAPGVHMRLVTSGLAGLPMRPFAIYRQNLGNVAQIGTLRQDITWVDENEKVLTAPFKLTKGQVVRGYLPVGLSTQCAWIRTLVDGYTDLTITAFTSNEYGVEYLASRSSLPFDISASYIQGIRLVGDGNVYGVRWLDVSTIPLPVKPWLVVPLPVKDGPRYVGLVNSKELAAQRVIQAAPLRFGMHDDPSYASPATAGLATAQDETNRVNALTPGLALPLSTLVNDMSLPQQKLVFQQKLSSGLPVGSNGTTNVNCLGAVLIGAADPGVGRWLGYVNHDPSPPGVAGDLVLYTIRGFWQIDVDTLDADQKLGLAAASAALITAGTPADPALGFPWPSKPADSGPGWSLYDFRIPVVATLGTAPKSPAAPTPGAPVHGNGPWLPEDPPTALREVTVPLSNLVPGACLAFARQDTQLNSLNLREPVTHRALALMVAHAKEGDSPDQGTVSDRECPETAVTYRLAQADWFGRWSGWALVGMAAQARPLPPTPTVEAFYEAAPIPDPMHDNKLWGHLYVTVPVPPTSGLPPGARLLDHLELFGFLGLTPFALNATPVPGNPLVKVEIPGPLVNGSLALLGRGAEALATIQARWVDTANTKSDASAPRKVKLVDPRPPEPVVIPPNLRYSARPDATGRARITLTWPVNPNLRYRVYVCDETRLVDALKGNAAFMQAWQAAETPAERGKALTDNKPLLLRKYFENLTGEALTPEPGAAQMSFQYDVSGSLRVLTLFRVVSVNSLNAESPWAQGPVVPFGVPNSGPPPRPLLELVPADKIGPGDPPLAPGAVRLRVGLIRGAVAPARYRLRRSSVSAGDPMRMIIAAEGALPAPVVDAKGRMHVDIDDAGACSFDPAMKLAPWTRYHWRVEVQAGNEPYTTIPGEWSPVSAPASTMIVPPVPVAPDGLTGAVQASAFKLSWHHPAPLPRGALGSYRFEIYRRGPQGGLETLIGERIADVPAAAGGRDPNNNYFFLDASPLGPLTTYRVVVVDPAGRRSPPSAPFTA